MLMTHKQREQALTLTKSWTKQDYFCLSLKDVSSSIEPQPLLENDMELPLSAHKILLVDDEEMVLLLAKSILSKMDYEVDAFTNPLEALDAYNLAPDSYLMLVTDQLMPQMVGTELVNQVHKIRSALPVIMLSGYSTEVSSSNVVDFGISKFLSKPVSFDLLCSTVSELLPDGRKDAG